MIRLNGQAKTQQRRRPRGSWGAYSEAPEEARLEKIGMDRSFIADLERGKRNITILNLEVLAQGFAISLSQLLSRL
jgi:transcriptional regulator with XRE-family HTH domain